jgi:hypothetical protein
MTGATCCRYTHIKVGSSDADCRALARPVGGNLYFAGEHTYVRCAI